MREKICCVAQARWSADPCIQKIPLARSSLDNNSFLQNLTMTTESSEANDSICPAKRKADENNDDNSDTVVCDVCEEKFDKSNAFYLHKRRHHVLQANVFLGDSKQDKTFWLDNSY